MKSLSKTSLIFCFFTLSLNPSWAMQTEMKMGMKDDHFDKDSYPLLREHFNNFNLDDYIAQETALAKMLNNARLSAGNIHPNSATRRHRTGTGDSHEPAIFASSREESTAAQTGTRPEELTSVYLCNYIVQRINYDMPPAKSLEQLRVEFFNDHPSLVELGYGKFMVLLNSVTRTYGKAHPISSYLNACKQQTCRRRN